ncbi:unnamed protein product [Blepharisma stoltei]|uniref:Uncharacterized protein n=1 Tax=Blepharisma stoltei TaxID=1481888 RepID=A0AAU9JGX1_9CILI|nr:unnamed protein product [Blepharisma stoltei]
MILWYDRYYHKIKSFSKEFWCNSVIMIWETRFHFFTCQFILTCKMLRFSISMLQEMKKLKENRNLEYGMPMIPCDFNADKIILNSKLIKNIL